jgi:hypothetical protein
MAEYDTGHVLLVSHDPSLGMVFTIKGSGVISTNGNHSGASHFPLADLNVAGQNLANHTQFTLEGGILVEGPYKE